VTQSIRPAAKQGSPVPPVAQEVTVSVHGLTKRYPGTDRPALQDVSFEVHHGEIFGLLGPSGCGKSTALNLVAGFIPPDAGVITIGGRKMTRVPSHKRGVGVVFQDYALFPHLSADRNIAYGLRAHGYPRAEIGRRCTELLEFVGLGHKTTKLPRELSGGEQQRVALARALAIEPQVILLDEPLSSLDTRLREQMRHDIRQILNRANATAILVTHDRAEAFEMCNRIAVLDAGQIAQIGRPLEVYSRPSSLHVAQLLGDVNVLPTTTLDSAEAGQPTRVTSDAAPAPLTVTSSAALTAGTRGLVLVRPEDLQISEASTSPASVQCEVQAIDLLGPMTAVRLSAGGVRLIATTNRHAKLPEVGQSCSVRWDPEAATFVAQASTSGERP
jgi:ABC-type Fe3+/spermidine/putrescine transport system ATPase subunit